MKKTLLLFLLLLTPFAHAYNPSNMVVEGAAWYTKDDGSYMTIRFFSLKHDKTTLYCTGWVLQSDYDEWDKNKDIPGHVATRKDFVDYFSKKQSSSNFPNYFDGDNNGLPDWRELIAGGEYLYWKDLGNGWQFYVNGQMMACNSDTNWENTLFKDLPPSTAQQYPDENHNGIPDVVDAAIAAGGGAVSEGGNITVTVNTQQIQVQVDNQPVLTALNNVIAKLDSLGAGSGGGDSGSGTSTGSAFHCDAQELKPTIEIIQAQTLSNFQALHALLSSLGAQYGLQLGDGIMRLGDPNTEDTLIKVARDLRYLLEKMRDDLNDGSWLLDERIKVKVHVEELDSVLQGMQAIKAVNEEIQSNTDGVLKHLQEVQQPTLQTIATNTKNTHDAILELIQEVKKINSGGPAFGQDPERENADDLLDETRSGIDSKKQDYEDDDQQTEDDAEELKDYHKDKQNHGERLRKKICQLFDIDIERSHPMKPSHQETGHHEITWYNTGPIARLTGDPSVKGRMLTQSFELDPRRFLDASETWNGEDSTIMKDAYRDIVIPAMDIARTFLLFIVAWNFFGAIFDLVKETWSA